MKKRYTPVFLSMHKYPVLFSVSSGLLLLSIIIGLFIKNITVRMLISFPFIAIFFTIFSFFLIDCMNVSKKYGFQDFGVISHIPLKKDRIILFSEIETIYIVVRTMPGDRGPFVSHAIIRDVIDKKRIIYDVILLKKDCPDRFITIDDSAYLLSECKEYVLYDFNYDSDSVLQLIKKTKVRVYTNKEMYSIMMNDSTFNGYKDRIILTNLNKPLRMQD